MYAVENELFLGTPAGGPAYYVLHTISWPNCSGCSLGSSKNNLSVSKP